MRTTDYNQFSFIKGNRKIKERYVKDLAKAIDCIDLSEYFPILVTSKFGIVDGQHRFEACKRLGKPIYFSILKEDVDINKAISILNTYQRTWRQEEYLNMYVMEDKQQYVDLYMFMKKYNITISNAMVIYCDPVINFSMLKSGKASIVKFAHADDVALFLHSPEAMFLPVRIRSSRPFVLSIRKAFEKYSKRNLLKLQRNILKTPLCATYEQYLQVFENIIK